MTEALATLASLLEAIDLCVEHGHIVPSLALLYTGIDVMASLDTQGEASRTGFIKWVNAYMLNDETPPCTAIELYAARCGVLHTFSAHSDLSRGGGIRKVQYASGVARAEHLEALSRQLNRPDYVAVHIDDLVARFRRGISLFGSELVPGSLRAAEVEKAAGAWFTHLPSGELDRYMNDGSSDA